MGTHGARLSSAILSDRPLCPRKTNAAPQSPPGILKAPVLTQRTAHPWTPWPWLDGLDLLEQGPHPWAAAPDPLDTAGLLSLPPPPLSPVHFCPRQCAKTLCAFSSCFSQQPQERVGTIITPVWWMGTFDILRGEVTRPTQSAQLSTAGDGICPRRCVAPGPPTHPPRGGGYRLPHRLTQGVPEVLMPL